MSARLRSVFGGVWSDDRLGALIAAGAAVAAGLLAGWLTPRGPLTVTAGLLTMVASLLLGLLAGLTMRSRWAMLLAPVIFVIVFELARIRADGPTVDGIHFSTYGLIAFVVGRGIHGVLALLPMALGAALGAAAARRSIDGPPAAHPRARAGLYFRRAVTALTAAVLLLVFVGVARQGSTDPILGDDGEPLEGSVAELTRVEIGGKDLAMMIRGRSTQNPVLLFLAGGPGGSELGAMREHLPALEDQFVVATWDQRGAGKSYAEIDPTETISPEQMVDDTIEVTNYLRDRFGREKIYLMGQSWGSFLGVLAIQEQPELYEAYIGTGQMVSPRETDRIFYQDTLEWARESGEDGLAETLEANGPPPYESILDYEPALLHEQDVYPYDHSRNSEGESGYSENLFVEEYTLLEQIHGLGAVFDTFSALYPQIQGIDLRESATRLEVPVYLIQGRNEAPGRATLAREWFRRLSVPSKELVVLDTSGHRPLFEQPARFTEAMEQVVPDGSQPVGTSGGPAGEGP